MNISQSLQTSFVKSLAAFKSRKGVTYIFILVLALIAFEAFNFSTTDFALSDLLGDLRFVGVPWSTLLTIAICGIDFAGIARLFAPQTNKEEPRSMWFLFGAWFLAATANALLTWWGMVLAMQTQPVLSAGVVNASFITRVVPIFIALTVWVIRILLIGTLSRQGERLLHEAGSSDKGSLSRREFRQAQSRAAHPAATIRSVPTGFTPSAVGKLGEKERGYRPEPKYIPMQDEMVSHSLKSSGVGQR